MALIDANVVTTRYAEETSPKVVDPNAIWRTLDVNTFGEYGPTYGKTPRRFFTADRQPRKGATTGLDVAGAVQVDFVQDGLQDISQGFFYADLRPKNEVVNDTGAEITDVAVAGIYNGPGLDTSFPIGTLVKTTNFSEGANNAHIGLVTAVAAGQITTDIVTALEAAPPQSAAGVEGAKIVAVGFQFDAGDLEVDDTDPMGRYTTTTKSFLDFNLLPGEQVFIGGDVTGGAGDQFTTPANNGVKRVRGTISANELPIDKSDAALVTEAGGTLVMRIFFGRLVRNESDPTLITRRTYQLERSLGAPNPAAPTELQGDYETGATPNTWQFVFANEDKLVVELGFLPSDYELIAAAAAPNLKSEIAAAGSGGAPPRIEEDAFNTTTDFTRLNISVSSLTSESPVPLFVCIEQAEFTIDNGAAANKALATRGSCENSIGLFNVTGTLTGYFETIEAIEAVRDNADVSFDAFLVKGPTGQKSGFSFDLPLISLGDGAPALELDAKIKLPLSTDAAAGGKVHSSLDYVAQIVFFDALPEAADTTV